MPFTARWLLAALIIFAAASAAAAAPRVKRDCKDCPELVRIPAGLFLMGSADKDPLHDSLETPQHEVKVRAFWAGRLDVTRDEWATFARATRRPTVKGCQWTGKADGNRTASWNDLGFPQTGRDPVVCVTWNDAQDYVRWLSRTTGHHYRLLSEAEWEYAARAGTSTAWWWDGAPSHDRANHGTETCCKGLAEGRDRWQFTSPGDAFPANAFGLHDMGGNVLQFVEDCFSPTYAGLPTDGSAFTTKRPIVATGDLKDLNGMPTCDFRVVRGGSWGDQRRWIRPAARSFAPPPEPGSTVANYRSGGVGFRVARD